MMSPLSLDPVCAAQQPGLSPALLELEKQRIKGFQWRGDERPRSRFDVTRRSLKPSEREAYEDVQMPVFRVSDRYFNRYMSNVYKQIMDREDARIRARARRDSIAAAAQDTALLAAPDSLLALPDSLLALPDSLAVVPEDIAPAAADSLQILPPEEEIDEEERQPAARRPRPVRREQTEEQPQAEAVEEKPQVVEQAAPAALPEMTPREQRILKKADRRIEKSDKRFFRKLYREVMRRK